jgi:endonuclease/exonuclease/phosphatase (EEP) superfamily protein YafD
MLILGWTLLLASLAVFATRWSRLAVALLIAVTVAVPLVPLVAVALLGWMLALQAWFGAAVAFGLLAVSGARWWPRRRPIATGQARVHIMSANLLVGCAEAGDLVEQARRLTVDVLAVQELTPEMTLALRAAGIDELFPHSVIRDGPDGTAIWSHLPLVGQPGINGLISTTAVAALSWPSGEVVTVASVHPRAPWPQGFAQRAVRELTALRVWLDSVDGPLVVAGDFNATTDHALFRALLKAGRADAASQSGSVWLRTFPSNSWCPPIAGLDHLVTAGAVSATKIRTVRIAGSDHRAVVGAFCLG